MQIAKIQSNKHRSNTPPEKHSLNTFSIDETAITKPNSITNNTKLDNLTWIPAAPQNQQIETPFPNFPHPTTQPPTTNLCTAKTSDTNAEMVASQQKIMLCHSKYEKYCAQIPNYYQWVIAQKLLDFHKEKFQQHSQICTQPIICSLYEMKFQFYYKWQYAVYSFQRGGKFNNNCLSKRDWKLLVFVFHVVCI